MTDLRDPNDRLYVYCTWALIAVTLAVTVIAVAYFIAYAPSEAYGLSEGEEPVGVALPIICGIVFVVCVYLLVRDLKDRLGNGPEEGRDVRFMRATLSKAGILLGVTTTFSMAFILLTELLGMGMSTDMMDGMNNYAIMASMMMAGPEEEFLCRILLIGIPMVIICAVMGFKGCLKYALGGFGMSRAALVLIVISAVIFALMHLDGWTIMKVPDTLITGLLFGYVFVQYGVHASIVMHSVFDMLACFDIFVDGMGTIPMIAVAVIGIPLVVRSVMKYRDYIPKNNMHESFEGNILQMWGRERLRPVVVGRCVWSWIRTSRSSSHPGCSCTAPRIRGTSPPRIRGPGPRAGSTAPPCSSSSSHPFSPWERDGGPGIRMGRG